MGKKLKNESNALKDFRPVVVGASLGGVQALVTLIKNLPQDLPAPVLVVLHTAPEGPGLLPQILERSGKLRSVHPEDGDPILPGRIYVAPPDCHLCLEPGRLRLTRGPKVNRTRPAIDVLFDSAAEVYGPKVIGVILTGSFSDGVAGLERIKQEGGITIVQDPKDAYCPDMPLNALRKVDIDFVLPVSEISELVTRLTTDSEAPIPPKPVEPRQEETTMKSKRTSEMGLTCPECHGPIHEEKQAAVTRYVCRVGHAFSTESFLAAHNESLERSLWAAVQMLEERAELLRRVAARWNAKGQFGLANLEQKAKDCDMHAATIRQVFEKLPRE